MTHITVDLTNTGGIIKPMNAVNNGPAGSRTRGYSSFDAFEQAEIPYARTHDSSYFEPYGGQYTVDVHRIFENFDADENDPASYFFGPTDQYMADILSVGCKPFYRLGASIEHHTKRGTIPPKDFAKWARICEHIIMHYNEGWANGFHYNIEYWEIWNEPECTNPDGSTPCWQGTLEEFGEFFFTSFTYLKTRFPHLKIGGPAFTSSTIRKEKLEAILGRFRTSELKPDFFSYHRYFHTIEKFLETVYRGREVADEYFGKDCECILNEWNYICGWLGDDFLNSVRTIMSLKGSAVLSAVMLAGQSTPVDMLMYYDARPCAFNGLYAPYTYELLKGYYALKNFATLRRLGTHVKTEFAKDDIYSCAATNGTDSACLLTYYNNEMQEDRDVCLHFENVASQNGVKVCYRLLDDTHDSELVREEIFTAPCFDCTSPCPCTQRI